MLGSFAKIAALALLSVDRSAVLTSVRHMGTTWSDVYKYAKKVARENPHEWMKEVIATGDVKKMRKEMKFCIRSLSDANAMIEELSLGDDFEGKDDLLLELYTMKNMFESRDLE